MDFLGSSKTYNSNQPDLLSEFAGKITSMKVQSGCGVIAFKERNYSGVRSFFDGNIVNLERQGFNDAIFSFKIVNFNDYECATIFYSEDNFQGDAQFYPANSFPATWSADDWFHQPLYHNDYYSSLRMVGRNAANCGVVAWENAHRQGDNRYFGNEAHAEMGWMSNKVSSFWIIQKTQCFVVFYSDNLFQGDARFYTSVENDLGNKSNLFGSFKLFGTSSTPCRLTIYNRINRPQGLPHLSYTGPHDQQNLPAGWYKTIRSFDVGTGASYLA